MKILIVSQHFYPENFRFNDLIFDLSKDNQVTVLTAIPNYPSGSFFSGYKFYTPLLQKIEGVTVIRVPIIPRGSSKFQLSLNYISFMFIGSLFGFILGLCRSFDRVLVCQTSPIFMAFPAIFYRFVRRAPVILWVTDLWPESLVATKTIKNQSALFALDQVVRWIYENVDTILVSCKGFVTSIKGKAPASNPMYFPYWAEDFYTKCDPDSSYSFSGPFKLMFAGNIGVSQNLELLVEAIALLPDPKRLQVIIAGSGRAKHSFESAIRERRLESVFTFLGELPARDMPGLFAHADALYLSLRKDPIFEITVPSKLQSYMACGKPVLASVDGETASIVSEAKCGLVAQAEDVHALATALQKLIEMSAEELAIMGQNSEKYYNRFFKRDKAMTQIRSFLEGSVR